MHKKECLKEKHIMHKDSRRENVPESGYRFFQSLHRVIDSKRRDDIIHENLLTENNACDSFKRLTVHRLFMTIE